MNFNQRQADAATGEINTLLCPMLDQAISDARAAEYAATRGSGEGDVAANRIGAGYIGLECERQLGFRYHKFPIEARESGCNPGELQRHAESGHWTEHKTAEWLRLCGIIIETVQVADGYPVTDQWGKPKQIGWKDAKDPKTGKYRLAGEVDGMITYVGDHHLGALIHVPAVWESKKATDKKWKKFVKDKVRGADPVYYGQIQTNMGYLGVTQTLFSMLNLDNMKYYFEIIPFDVNHAQGLVNRAVGVFNTETPYALPRLGRSEDDWVCKYCDYQRQCWHGENGTVHVTPQPGFFNPKMMGRGSILSYQGVFRGCVPTILRLYRDGVSASRIAETLNRNPREKWMGYQLNYNVVRYILERENAYVPGGNKSLERGAMRRMFQRDKWQHATPETIYRETEGYDF